MRPVPVQAMARRFGQTVGCAVDGVVHTWIFEPCAQNIVFDAIEPVRLPLDGHAFRPPRTYVSLRIEQTLALDVANGRDGIPIENNLQSYSVVETEGKRVVARHLGRCAGGEIADGVVQARVPCVFSFGNCRIRS